jgi:hypothetical protein
MAVLRCVNGLGDILADRKTLPFPRSDHGPPDSTGGVALPGEQREQRADDGFEEIVDSDEPLQLFCSAAASDKARRSAR